MQPKADWQSFSSLDDTIASEFTTTLTEKRAQIILFALAFLEIVEWENLDSDDFDGTLHDTINAVIDA